MASEEGAAASITKKISKKISGDKRLIVVLEKASLEAVKVGKSFELLNCDKHRNMAKKFKRDIATCRPDIAHQCLLMLLDSPLNRAGLLQVYIHTEKNVLIEVNPQTRIPRTFDRFCGLMVQLLHKLSISAADGPQKLLKNRLDETILTSTNNIVLKAGINKLRCQYLSLPRPLSEGVFRITSTVIKNPVTEHLPVGCVKVGMSFQAEECVNPRTLVPKSDQPIVFVIGAMAHGSVDVDYTEKTCSISNYPLSGALTCAKLCTAFEEEWGVV